MTDQPGPSFVHSLVAGGCAGFGVDVSLFPMDTIKTRLQSSQGFWKAGGFTGVYNGLGSAALGSAPSSAFFFATYEQAKKVLVPLAGEEYTPLAHCLAASCGEVMACLVRVPTENVKQKMQAGLYPSTAATIRGILAQGGPGGFFTGYGTTVMRDVPFSFLQFPVYEKFKKLWAAEQGSPLQPWQGAVCGSVSGAFAGAITTPLDVAKTRLMLGADSKGVPYSGMFNTLQRVHAEGGVQHLFSGLAPRVIWISIGGLVFFGIYETAISTLAKDDQE